MARKPYRSPRGQDKQRGAGDNIYKSHVVAEEHERSRGTASVSAGFHSEQIEHDQQRHGEEVGRTHHGYHVAEIPRGAQHERDGVAYRAERECHDSLRFAPAYGLRQQHRNRVRQQRKNADSQYRNEYARSSGERFAPHAVQSQYQREKQQSRQGQHSHDLRDYRARAVFSFGRFFRFFFSVRNRRAAFDKFVIHCHAPYNLVFNTSICILCKYVNRFDYVSRNFKNYLGLV